VTVTAPVRVVVVDDHDVVRHGLVALLQKYADVEVVGSYGSGAEALDAVARSVPDLVLLDLQMPRMSGLEVLARIRSMAAPPHVIVLTAHGEDDLVLGAVRGGADGYVLKSAPPEELLTAIRSVAQGGQRFDEVVVQALLKEDEQQRDRTLLTPREVEILRLVACGHSNKEIGRLLFVSVGTVKDHLEAVYRKLEVSDRTHAVAVALRKGLLDED
jgi:DNA-binding NarL/FixJ family response regulator